MKGCEKMNIGIDIDDTFTYSSDVFIKYAQIYNETKNIDFKESKKINEFYDILKKNGIDVTVRRKFGNKISAACGQLRSKEV